MLNSGMFVALLCNADLEPGIALGAVTATSQTRTESSVEQLSGFRLHAGRCCCHNPLTHAQEGEVCAAVAG